MPHQLSRIVTSLKWFPNKLHIEWWKIHVGKEDVNMLHERGSGDRLTTCGWLLLFWRVFTSHVCRSYHVDSCGVFDFTSISLIFSCFTVCLLNTCYVDLVNLSLMSLMSWWFWSQPGGVAKVKEILEMMLLVDCVWGRNSHIAGMGFSDFSSPRFRSVFQGSVVTRSGD